MRFFTTMLLGALLAGCATGFGEEATGTAEVTLLPHGDESAGVHFTSVRLALHEVELIAAEPVEEPVDDGHGHLTLALEDGHAEEDGHGHEEEPLENEVQIDLLGGEQTLLSEAVAIGEYVELALAAEEALDGCAFLAEGTFEAEELAVTICLAAPDGHLAELAIDLDVELDETATLPLAFHLEELLEGLDPASLAREEDGSILIGRGSNEAAAARAAENLAAAFEVEEQ